MATIQINQVSPMAGVVAGGMTVTITGSGFQEGIVAYFGSQLAEKTIFESDTIIKAVVPAINKPGTVAVTVVNPDDSQGVQTVGFIYITPENSDRTEVIGISPLTVIEGDATEIILHGRNIIEAYNNGLVALRCPSRVSLDISNVITGEADESGVESLTFKVVASASPALNPLDRVAIQVLASRRPESKNDLIVESSKQMFVVLPRDIAVPIAYTPNLSSDKPTMVVVLGRNLAGCTLQFGEAVQTHLQKSDEDSLMGLVTLSDKGKDETITEVSILDKNGNAVGQYSLSIAESSELTQSEPIPSEREILMEGISIKLEDAPVADFTIDLAPVSNQQLLGPTAEDSSLYDLKGELSSNLTFNSFGFEVAIFTYQIHIPIINRVYLFPIFDGGGRRLGSPISAQVGKLFPVRGSGILFAARIEITITVTVMVIITIDFPWLYGGFNEFPEQFPNAVGIVISGVVIDIDILIIISFLTALVLPDGRLRLLFRFHLEIDIDFTISSDGRHLNFVPHVQHFVRYFSILPFAEQFPCGGRFQLADDNGQTVFTDLFGGQQSYYFAHSAGECCVPWAFNLELVRVNLSGNEQVAQPPFNASMCIAANPSPHLINVIITSLPPPQGIPPTLTMDVADTAIIQALAQRVDETGNPTGEPPQDLRDLGYGVDFFLRVPLEEVLDSALLLPGDAVAIEEGQNIISAAVTSEPTIVDDLGFWFGGILSFNILQYLEQGQEPRFNVGGLPVSVNPLATTIRVEPTLAYRDANGQLVASPNSEIERYEPFETQREYVLAVKLTVPAGTSYPQTVRFKVEKVQMRVLPNGSSTPQNKAPLDIPNARFGRNRIRDDSNIPTTNPQLFFTGTLIQVNQEFSVTINSAPSPNDLIEVSGAIVLPNHKEVKSSNDENLINLVPPGNKVGNRDVLLNITFKRLASPTGANTYFSRSELKLKVVNDETFEEYLRVFYEAQKIMTDAEDDGEDLREFAKTFFEALSAQRPSNSLLKLQGEKLWKFGYEYVQGTIDAKDDRLLYYARLQSIAALRSYYKRNNLTLNQTTINRFEWQSRGLETTDGINASIIFSPTTSRKAIVTGYDPFVLPEMPDRSNPSGIVALEFNKKTTFGTAQAPVLVRTAIFPVRYGEFNNGLIEKVIESSLHSKVIIMTCSQGRNFYDVDRFASKRRGIDYYDNNLEKLTSDDPGLNGGEFIESNLPYEIIITRDNHPKLPGPNDTSPGANDTPFVMNQSYLVRGQPRIRAFGKYLALPEFDEPESYTKLNEQPMANSPLEEGSGSNFLSNEIFYRTALVRSNLRPSLPSGHLHIPKVDNKPKTKANRLINGVTQILQSFLQHLFPLQNSGNITFPETLVNTTSSPKILTLNNPLDSDLLISIASVQINPLPPFAVQLPSPLPIVMEAGSSNALSFTFAPTIIGDYVSTVTLTDTNGSILLVVELKGKCVPFLPRITSFSPTQGRAETIITILGEHLDGATDVRIGTTSIPFSVINAMQITATVTDEVFTAFVYVDTPFGTAVSATTFRYVIPPNQQP